MHALRGGTVAGEHRVLFFGEKEELEIRHRADDREIFARGAMRALAFAVKAKPGMYNMEDVLFGGTAQ
jgi:4-hydroxy-tetrahydrodipicolinate reductase